MDLFQEESLEGIQEEPLYKFQEESLEKFREESKKESKKDFFPKVSQGILVGIYEVSSSKIFLWEFTNKFLQEIQRTSYREILDRVPAKISHEFIHGRTLEGFLGKIT